MRSHHVAQHVLVVAEPARSVEVLEVLQSGAAGL